MYPNHRNVQREEERSIVLILLSSVTIDLSSVLRKRKDEHGPPLPHRVTLTAKTLVRFGLFSVNVSLKDII